MGEHRTYVVEVMTQALACPGVDTYKLVLRPAGAGGPALYEYCFEQSSSVPAPYDVGATIDLDPRLVSLRETER